MRNPRSADYPGCPATVAEAAAAGVGLRETRWGLRDCAITLAGAWLVSVLGAVLLAGLVSGGVGIGLGTVVLVGTMLPWVFLVGWPVWATRRWGNGPVIDLGWAVRWSDLLWGAAGGGLALVGGLLAVKATEMITGDFESAAGQAASRIAESSPRWQVWLFAFIVGVAAPIVEEVAFRGMVWSGLARSGLPAWGTATATTIIFAVFHFEPVRIGVLLATGWVLAWLRWQSGRLGASTIAHMVNNAPAALGILLLPG